MGIEVNADCDECGANVEGDNVYCESCYDELKTKLEDAEAKIEELEEELAKCKEGCGTCDNKVECVVTKSKR
jgi:chromosome segregation ATPase